VGAPEEISAAIGGQAARCCGPRRCESETREAAFFSKRSLPLVTSARPCFSSCLRSRQPSGRSFELCRGSLTGWRVNRLSLLAPRPQPPSFGRRRSSRQETFRFFRPLRIYGHGMHVVRERLVCASPLNQSCGSNDFGRWLSPTAELHLDEKACQRSPGAGAGGCFGPRVPGGGPEWKRPF